MLWHKIQGAGGLVGAGGSVEYVELTTSETSWTLSSVEANDLILCFINAAGVADRTSSNLTLLARGLQSFNSTTVLWGRGVSSGVLSGGGNRKGLVMSFRGVDPTYTPEISGPTYSTSGTVTYPTRSGFLGGDMSVYGIGVHPNASLTTPYPPNHTRETQAYETAQYLAYYQVPSGGSYGSEDQGFVVNPYGATGYHIRLKAA